MQQQCIIETAAAY